MGYTITTSDGLGSLRLEKISSSVYYGTLNTADQMVISFNREFFVSVIGMIGALDINLTESGGASLCGTDSVLVHVSKGDRILISAGNTDGNCVVILYETDFLDLLKNNPLHNPEVRNVIVDQPSVKVLANRYIRLIATDLIGNKLPPSVSHIHRKAKVLEVFAMQLEGLISLPGTSSLNIRNEDIRKIRMARQLIEENTDHTYTISELARHVGTNEQYLKKFFKHFYGKTIYKYMLSCKMEKAKELILNGGTKIAVIAQQTGYKHPTHFSAAFKRYFGYLPQSLKCIVMVHMDLVEWLFAI